jgi:uncharacterized DUF497 family protein
LTLVVRTGENGSSDRDTSGGLDKTTGRPYIMDSDRFEWSSEKAATNLLYHGVAFENAIKVFRDPFAIEWIDDREDYGEERVNLVGMCDGTILHITYTERGDHIRIISARQAEKHEREDYYRENAR